MKVTLISHTPEPEKIIAAAAKLCYSSSGADKLLEGLTPERTESFVTMLSEIGHESPIEHVSFTFGIEGISRALLAQITRHRIASYSVQSQRYVKINDFQYVTPPEIADVPEALELFQESMNRAVSEYHRLAEILEEKHYKAFITAGIPEKQARSKAEKKAIEDARFVLPNASETKMVVTMNARSLMNFFRLRCCNRAQWEIKAVADEMLRLCSKVAPTLFLAAGPECVKGHCPEGKMSCGKAPEMKKFYEDLKHGL